jgi:hypothetical protein
MTENDAATKWCPQTPRQIYQGDEFHGCIGSFCMVWRWTMTPESAALHNENSNQKTHIADGYCGLAGKP